MPTHLSVSPRGTDVTAPFGDAVPLLGGMARSISIALKSRARRLVIRAGRPVDGIDQSLGGDSTHERGAGLLTLRAQAIRLAQAA